MRCYCGHAFGSQSVGSVSCTRCGSSIIRRIGSFGDALELAEAVSSANLPKEIARQVTRRAHSYEELRKSHKSNASVSAPDLLMAMRSATNSGGHLTITSLANELREMEITEPTAERLIGQAEMEGVLMRSGRQTWSWL